jgi:hypothetical protein
VVKDVIHLGEYGGEGNLVIAQVVRVHLKEHILDAEGQIDPGRLDAVSRLGGNWYGRAKEGLFEVPKPLRTLGIGVDALPRSVRNSKVLSGNDLGQLGNQEALPEADTLGEWKHEGTEQEIHEAAREMIAAGKVSEALHLLVANS